MKHRYIILTLCLVLSGINPAMVRALDVPAPTQHLLILAVQTGQVGATGNDFVEVYNPSSNIVDVTGWKLQYRAAASVGTSTWISKRTVACVPAATGCVVSLPAHGHIVFSTYDLLGWEGEQPMSTGLSDVGGQLRLVQPSGSDLIIHDIVGYGTAAEAEGGQAAPAPALGETLVRLATNDVVTDTNNNFADFAIFPVGCYGMGGTSLLAVNNLCVAPPPVDVPPPVVDDPPQTDTPPTEPEQPPSEPTPTPETPPVPDAEPPVVTDPAPTPPPEPVPEPTPDPTVYLPLEITELLPDPASPATDDADEYVELFNPGTEPVNAEGYVLETGTNFSYHFTLSGIVVPAGGYVTVMSAQSNLVLSNTAGIARLLDPTGTVIDQTAAYESAKVGQTWAKIDNLWQWTTEVTPGLANMATPLPPVEDDVPPTDNTDTPPPTDPPAEEPQQPETTETINYPTIFITELLPNPASPAQDSTDEFIELFNPNTSVVNLAGYTLETGSDFRYKFAITNTSIAAGGYLAVKSATSHLTLTNSGSVVRLIDPNGQVVGTLVTYGSAKDGQAWVKMSDGWHWTTTPTPGALNKVTSPPVNKASTKAKKPTTKKAKTTKAVAAAKTVGSGSGPFQSDHPESTLNYLFFVVIAVAILGYVIYEYRLSISRLLRKLRLAPQATRRMD